jgi:hypothetical protein
MVTGRRHWVCSAPALACDEAASTHAAPTPDPTTTVRSSSRPCRPATGPAAVHRAGPSGPQAGVLRNSDPTRSVGSLRPARPACVVRPGAASDRRVSGRWCRNHAVAQARQHERRVATRVPVVEGQPGFELADSAINPIVRSPGPQPKPSRGLSVERDRDGLVESHAPGEGAGQFHIEIQQ